MILYYKHIVPTGLKREFVILYYKHIVPTGLKRGFVILYYKHIVPTGLKSISSIFDRYPIAVAQYRTFQSKPLLYIIEHQIQ